MDESKILARLVQEGIVTDVDRAKRRARVLFPTSKMVSGWLYVLKSQPYIPDYDGPQKTQEKAGGSGEAAFASHTHELVIKPWLPKINDRVLCLYLPVQDGDGYILGGI